MSQIRNIHARQILDSRGNPTLEVDITSVIKVSGEQQFLVVPQQVSMKQ